MNRTTIELFRRSVSIAFALALLVAVPPALVAHEGHNHNEHKERCTLQKIEAGKIEIKAEDGDLETVRLTAETKILREGKAITTAELKLGEKAIVTMIHEKVGARATEIRVGAEKAGSQGNEERRAGSAAGLNALVSIAFDEGGGNWLPAASMQQGAV